MTTIAVIDDDENLLDLMAHIFAERNWTILPLRDADTAMETLKQERPDAVLLDVRLPRGTSGWDVLEQVQTEPETSSIPVVIWTDAVHLLDEIQERLTDHRIPVLSKPFELDTMYAYLDQALDKRPVLRDERLTVSA